MKKKKLKPVLSCILLLLFLFGLTPPGKTAWAAVSRLFGTDNRDAIADDYALTLHFLPVGKADALLIEQEEQFILVDAGTVNTASQIEAYLLRRGVKNLDAVFISHPDSDHLGALSQLLDTFSVSRFYTVDAEGESEAYFAMLDALREQKIAAEYLQAGDCITLGALTFNVLSPSRKYDAVNDLSLVLRMTYQDFSALLTGDAGKAVEETLLESEIPVRSDVLKIAHHGSKTGSTEAFLQAVSPQIAVISTGPDRNRLPDGAVLKQLKHLQISYCRTDLDGAVIISSNGSGTLSISTKEKTHENIEN